MKSIKYLANLGYGSRREVTRMFDEGRVTRLDGTVLVDGEAVTHDEILVDDEPLDPAPGAVLMLHKPVGYVCSTREASQLVYELLPDRFRERTPIVAPVGRLDRDTSGLLLLTDDGHVNHRITSPRTHLPKTYDAELAHDLTGDEGERFASGALMLDGEDRPLEPATLEVIDARHARLVLTEGRYHQARRMFAAVGNHVTALHRSAVGHLELGDLAVGAWRALRDGEVAPFRGTAKAR